MVRQSFSFRASTGIFVFLVCSVLFFSCIVSSNDGNSLSPSDSQKEEKTHSNTVSNPKPYTNRAENLDYIFDPDVLGETEITLTRKEWQKLLIYFDISKTNESFVHADYKFTKGGKIWEFTNVGFRIRGNTSRKRPQLVKNNEGNTKCMEAFSGYQNNYVQSHFKIDFEEWLTGNDECKMADCMKGIILKHFKGDPTHTREVYGYNLFRKNGIWISPRASYTKLTINIKDSNGTTEKVNYGLYAMVEEINKQFVKARREKNNGGTFISDEGNLWKCTGSAPMTNPLNSIGVEEKSITNLRIENEAEPWNGNITADKYEKTYSYDLKTNKKSLAAAKTEFTAFVRELNALNTSDTESVKNWFNEKMDVDLFLKTYAVNVLLGMWDDYWVNQSNYYFYFDPGDESKSGKAYFIPYDYDNILGCNLKFDSGKQNPLEWGSLNDGQRPLIQKMLSVPEFMELYKKYLVEFSKEGSYFSYEKSIETLTKWKNMVEPLIASDQINWVSESYSEWGDYFADWGYPDYFTQYKLFSGDDDTNYFKARIKCVNESVSVAESENDENEEEYIASGLAPVTYDSVKGSYVFIFLPKDFGVDYDGSQNMFVRGSFYGWSDNLHPMIWNESEGYYSLETAIESLGDNPRYKFWHDDGTSKGIWFGGAEYRGVDHAVYCGNDDNQNLIFPQ